MKKVIVLKKRVLTYFPSVEYKGSLCKDGIEWEYYSIRKGNLYRDNILYFTHKGTLIECARSVISMKILCNKIPHFISRRLPKVAGIFKYGRRRLCIIRESKN